MKRPLWGVFSIIICSTDFLKFVSLDSLPYFQLGGGLRINILDAQLIIFFLISVWRLIQAKKSSIFAKPVILLLIWNFTLLAISIILGMTDLDVGLQFYRIYFVYVVFFILISAIDSMDDLKKLFTFIQILLISSVLIQVLEYTLGHRISSPFLTDRYYSEGVYLQISGEKILYTWNRGTFFLYVGTIISLAVMFYSKLKMKAWYGVVVFVGIFGFVIALVRQWYLYLLAGIIVVLLFSPKRRITKTVLSILSILFALLLINQVFFPDILIFKKYILPDAFVERTVQLIHITEQGNYLGRVDQINKQMNDFLESPIIGHGLGKGTISNDTGFFNTLVQQGVMGVIPLVYVLFFFLIKGSKLIFVLRQRNEETCGYLIGAVATLVGLICAYLVAWPVFAKTVGIVTACIIFGIIDRIYEFSYKETPII